MNQTGSILNPQHLKIGLWKRSGKKKKKVSIRRSHNIVNYKTDQTGMWKIFQIGNTHKLLR